MRQGAGAGADFGSSVGVECRAEEPMRATVAGIVAAIGFVGAGRVAPAGDDADRGPRVEALVRALESSAASERAKAAAELGALFPEGATAGPVLIDAAEDDDAAVRTASIASLRRLGRAGLETVARQMGDVPPATRSTIIAVVDVLAALGEAVTPTDLAAGIGGA